MFLQDGKPRRKPLVYGKSNRSISSHTIFDIDDTLGGGNQSHISSSEDGTAMAQQQTHGHVVKSIEATPKGKLSIIRRRLAPSQKPPWSSPSNQKESRSMDEMDERMSAFDLPMSDEEDTTILFEKSMQKRRRLTPVRNPNNNAESHQRESSGSKLEEHSNRGSNLVRPALPLQAQIKQSPKSKSRSRVKQQSPQRRRAPIPEDSISSPASNHITPKQTRLLSDLLDSAGPTDSPSKLPLKSLSLTNGQHSGSESIDSSSETCVQTIDTRARLIKPRKRLIDAMVSPQKRLSISASSESNPEDPILDAAETLPTSNDRKAETRPATIACASEVNGKDKMEGSFLSNSSTSLNASSKPRATYSKERSHLSEMITEDILDPLSQSASQGDSPPTSQRDILFSSFGSVVSQKAVEEDLEDEVAGIRSIHELRHSGGNARSQVDLESIFEDIEAQGSSARARRLRGLTQLAEKLRDPEVGRHLSQQSLDQRLSRLPHLDGDLVGQLVLTILLSRLMVSVQLPIASLRRTFEVLLPLGRALLPESRDIESIVRDRKQNLSKATFKEIIALVEPFCSSLVWPDRRPKSLSPRLIFIRSLDIVLRQARQFGDFGMILPASIFGQLVHLLLKISPAHLIDANDNDPVLVMESTVSVIESLTISEHWADGGCLEIAKKLSGLGPILDQLTVSSAQSFDQTRHLILRLILNITNNDPGLCDAFNETKLISAVFGIVKRDFLETPTMVNGALEVSRLEGVILALGALSNLAEHSSHFRLAMLDQSLGGRNLVDWIAVGFRDEVEVASEASSVEQTTSLVAFGYLSVLLCNLCMDRQIRARVRRQLKGATLQTLLLFVQEFLDHFRRAEELERKQEDEDSRMNSGFVDRFGGVLIALRHAEGLC